jgi:PKD repeat protein
MLTKPLSLPLSRAVERGLEGGSAGAGGGAGGSYTDGFEREDGALGTSDNGAVWSVVTGTPEIVDGGLKGTVAGQNIAKLIVPGANTRPKRALIHTSENFTSLGFLPLMKADNDFILVYLFGDATTRSTSIFKNVAGAFTQLAQRQNLVNPPTGWNPNENVTVEFDDDGTDWVVTIDGVEILRYAPTGGERTDYATRDTIGFFTNRDTDTGEAFVAWIDADNGSHEAGSGEVPGGDGPGSEEPPNVLPVAEANGPYAAVTGELISFSSLGSSDSDGTIASYEWTFGDGNTSTQQHPQKSYAAPGTFQGTLKVIDDDGAEHTDSFTVEIVAPNQRPMSKANGPYAAQLGTAIQYSSAGSTDSDGVIVSYLWDFGDGNTSTAANPQYTHANTGVFNGSLIVTDDDGAQSSEAFDVTISPPPGPPPVSTVDIQPTSLTVVEAASGSLLATARDSSGTFLDDESYAWEEEFGDTTHLTVLDRGYIGRTGLVNGILAGGAPRVRCVVRGVPSNWIPITVAPLASGNFFIRSDGVVTNIEKPRSTPTIPALGAWVPDVVIDVAAKTGSTPGAKLTNALLDAAITSGQNVLLLLDDGVNYDGNFVLPARPGNMGWVKLACKNSTGWLFPMSSLSGFDSSKRAKASNMVNAPKVRGVGGGSAAAIRLVAGSHRYWLDGLEVRHQTETGTLTALIRADPMARASTPTGLIMTRMFVHGGGTLGLTRCLQANWNQFYFADCSFTEARGAGIETQAINVYAADGVWFGHNCRLQGGAENFMSGGGNPVDPAHIPADIYFQYCEFDKPLEWKGSPYGPVKYTVKNIFELKSGLRVHCYRCIFRGCWTDGQTGMAFNLKVSNPGSHPGVLCKSALFEECIILDAGYAVQTSLESGGSAGVAEFFKQVAFSKCVFYRIDPPSTYDGAGKLWQLQMGVDYVILDHVTAVYHPSHSRAQGNGNTMDCLSSGLGKSVGCAIINSIIGHSGYGIRFSGTGSGQDLLDIWESPSLHHNTFDDNGNLDYSLLGTNLIEANGAAVIGFTDWAAATLAGLVLAPASPSKNTASDGTDRGAPISAMLTWVTGAEIPVP